jgi:bifunctional non-homologous end joining protein LigD
MALAEYNQKRRFSDTPEPKGKLRKSGKKLEFVIQKHHATRLHYDFRLELDGVLKSWAVPKGPSLNPGDKRLAMMVEDHPYEYRKFEGTIPEGNYGAGSVIIWDRGWYELDRQEDSWPATLRDGLDKGELKFILHGEKLNGSFALIKTPHMGAKAWLLIKHRDKYASEKDVTKLDKSVISGQPVDPEPDSAEDAAKAPKSKLPTKVKPMLATLTDEAFDDPDWIYEIKWDGYRAIGTWDGQTAELYSRNGLDFSQKYPPVFEALRQLKKPAVIDGEVVVLDKDGKSRFELLQNYGNDGGQLVYYVFDLLWLDGHDVTDLPLAERKKLLKSIVPKSLQIRYSDHIEDHGTAFFKSAQKAKLEGIMAKDKHSLYRPGVRTDQWLKIKTHLRQEAIICGFTEPRGSRQHIGALILGVHKRGKLKYVGHASAGSNAAKLKELRQNLEKLEVANSPFSEKIRPNAPVHWVRPKLLAEVSFSEWTKDGLMRQPIFKGLRTDKDPKEVIVEKSKSIKAGHSNISKLELSHLDKVFWPEKGYTKGDLVNYYRGISEVMLPYIKDRPHNLLRQPNGYKGKSFFRKDMGDLPPEWVKTVSIYSESNEKDINYMVCDSVDSLLYMVQLGSIEINPWNSRVKNLTKPDWVVIDLDPEDVPFNQVVEVANIVRLVTEELSIPTYPKTSGKTGIHIYMPLAAKYDYDQAKKFGEILAHLVHRRTDNITSLERSPAKRQKKIYLDFLQNREGQTLAAPYSVRPTKDATVSTPLKWEELNSRLKPTMFTIKNMQKRLDKVGDLWQPVIGKGIDIEKILKNLSE